MEGRGDRECVGGDKLSVEESAWEQKGVQEAAEESPEPCPVSPAPW